MLRPKPKNSLNSKAGYIFIKLFSSLKISGENSIPLVSFKNNFLLKLVSNFFTLILAPRFIISYKAKFYYNKIEVEHLKFYLYFVYKDTNLLKFCFCLLNKLSEITSRCINQLSFLWNRLLCFDKVGITQEFKNTINGTRNIPFATTPPIILVVPYSVN